VAEAGVPVFVVPGNHERSRIPHAHLASHPNLHIFRRPQTHFLNIRGKRIALTGFPYERRRVRERFGSILKASNWEVEPADVRLLCMHHCVEGATVGPSDYTFRNAPDVVRCSDLPTEFAAVLSGHIHRHQVLQHDLRGQRLLAPVLYPGSVERTAFAEMEEEKGYMLVEVEPGPGGGRLTKDDFIRLPARPMVFQTLCPLEGPGGIWTSKELSSQLQESIAEVPREAVLRVKIDGTVPAAARRALTAERLRALAPPEMNLEAYTNQARSGRRVGRPRGSARTDRNADQQFLALSPLP
jgi:DNA repair exonuclease SbcCD nuclease subunit